MNDPVDVLAQLTKAGGMVGISNNKWWLDLVIAHGAACVLAIVDEIHADTRQVVNVATVAKRCEKEARQKQDEADDAAEDAAMRRQMERSPLVGKANGTTAVVVSEPASIAAAIDAHSIREALPTSETKRAAAQAPWGLRAHSISQSNPETFMNKTDVKKLISQVEEEIARRGISLSVAMGEVGVSAPAIYNWRKGQIGNAAIEKINTWLPESAKQPPAGDVSQAETVALEKKPRSRSWSADGVAFAGLEEVKILGSEQHKKRRTPPASDASPAMDLSDLLTQGANLRDALNALGATGHADVVQQFVDRLRTMRAALGG